MLFQIRVTGVLVDGGKILIVKQNVSDHRSWSLPGGRLEAGETLEDGVVRKIQEETGNRIVDKSRQTPLHMRHQMNPPLLHITFPP